VGEEDRLPHLTPPAPDADSGRGLVLVDALADRWGVTPGPRPRKTVRAELTAQEWDECEINRIVDERTANPAASIPIEDVMRGTLERGPRRRHLERAQQWDEESFRRRHAAEKPA
jgi:hypothetical protein